MFFSSPEYDTDSSYYLSRRGNMQCQYDLQNSLVSMLVSGNLNILVVQNVSLNIFICFKWYI